MLADRINLIGDDEKEILSQKYGIFNRYLWLRTYSFLRRAVFYHVGKITWALEGGEDMDFEEILNMSPYSLDAVDKYRILTDRLGYLTRLHNDNCTEYRNILQYNRFKIDECMDYRDFPFLPVRLFKELELKSVPSDSIVKTMTSSGTTGQEVSKIYLDRVTSSNQQKAMVKIVSDFTGSARMPMIIIDCPNVVKDRTKFSARGAGILGFSIFGRKKIFALKDDMSIDIEGVSSFIADHKDERILLFGFTFIVWQHFYKELMRLKENGMSFDLSNAVLIHGGGWKKLESEAISREEFHRNLKNICGLKNIYDYYGMVEQTGCIYMECECGHFHASNFSDVIVRRAKDFSLADVGEKGIIQVVSTIPVSYPGHSLLTEDEGIIDGIDDCPCGRKGKYFRILGRIKKAEIRGCSDTYGDRFNTSLHESNKVDLDPINKITFIEGNRERLDNMENIYPLEPFSDVVKAFLDDVSKELMRNHEAKIYPDIVTLGFWLRRSSVDKLDKRFCYNDGLKHIGRGVAFHISPSNVPVNFAYSLFAGLLSGCSNIVRIPSKDFPQVRIIVDVIKKILDKHTFMRDYICLISYERDKNVNDILSKICDVRIIWGGNKTIEELRKSPINARTTEILFADRYSIAVIDSDYYMTTDNKERVALDFYNDTYLSDQNACTSPRVVVWMGNCKIEAKKIFWNELHKLIEKKYIFQDVMAVDKLDNAYQMASRGINSWKINSDFDNLIVRVGVDTLDRDLMDFRGNCGFFYEYDCDNVMDLHNFCDDTRCQTIGILGVREMIEPLLDSGIKGVDRIVPIGHTMDFDLNWDGYNLVNHLSRGIDIKVGFKRKIIIFDIDGTLFDTKNGIVEALKHTFEVEGLVEPNECILQSFIGPPIKDSFIRLFNMQEDEADRVIQNFRNIYMAKYLDKSEPYEHVKSVVSALKGKGYVVSIASMKPLFQVKRLLDNHNMADLFDYVEGADDDGSKDKAIMIENICKQVKGIDKKNVIMVGDTYGDYKSAQDVGCEFVGVLYGYGFNKDMKYDFRTVCDLADLERL